MPFGGLVAERVIMDGHIRLYGNQKKELPMNHGGDIYTYKKNRGHWPIDFSANINPLGLPRRVKEALAENLDMFTHYPDVSARDLTQSVAAYEGISEEEVIFGNGAAEIIYRLVQVIKPGKALLVGPTFSEYEKAVRTFGGQCEYVKVDDEFGIGESFIDRISDHQLVVLCNPNNPTGLTVTSEYVRRLAVKCREQGAFLLIDECFMDFVVDKARYSFLPHIHDFENLLVLKAFTKFFAMAGLRLGYGITSNTELLFELKGIGQPWNISVPAQIAGVAALEDQKYIDETPYAIQKERQFMVQALTDMGWKVINGQANYIFFSTGMREKEANDEFMAYCLEKGFLIRDCSNYHYLSYGFYRIAVGSEKDNQSLLGCFKDYLNN